MPEALAWNAPFLLGGLLTTLGIAAAIAVLGTVLAMPMALLRWGRVRC